MFSELHKQFESKKTDLHKLQKENGFSRYILIRSLANEHLKELIEKLTGEKVKSNDANFLYEKLFDSKATLDDLISYIKSKYTEIGSNRKDQEKYLPNIIKEFGTVKSGVRNDNLNDKIKSFVRDKSIKSKEDLEQKIGLLLTTIKGYILWQYYNQATNDLIEHIFNDHKNVIPTLRKITYIDFFIRKGDEIIPFDLKVTHISDHYFELHKKGLIASTSGNDSFTVGSEKTELELIKKYYKSVKRKLSLPNYGKFSKTQLIEKLRSSGNADCLNFVEKCIESRNNMVSEIEKNLIAVEWWNYKYQEPRLFKNNNRFFVFLAYNGSFGDARSLKGNLKAIEQKVNDKLESILDDSLNIIHYNYQKDAEYNGNYVTESTSILLTGNE